MKKTTIADLTLLLIAFIWGATFVVVQNAISFLDANTFNAVRFTIAGSILTLYLLIFNRNLLDHISQKLIVSGIFLGFLLFIGYSFQTMGLLFTTSSKAGFITGLSVILVPIFSFLLFKNKIGLPAIIGVMIATVGLYLLTMTGTSPINLGDFLVFVCAFGFAMHIIMTGKYTKIYSALLLTIIQIFTVAILSWITAMIFEDWQAAFQASIMFKAEVLFGLIITSVFATALAFLVQTHFQKYTTPTHTALIFATEPVFAALTAFIWVNEVLTTSALIGAIFIFSGMVLAELPIKKKRQNSLSEKLS